MAPRDRLNYVMDHNNPTPGTNRKKNEILLFLSTHVSFQVMYHVNRVNKYSIDSIDTTSKCFHLFPFNKRLSSFLRSWEDTTKTTSTTTTPAGSTKPVTTTWEQHWSRLDDGSGRYVYQKSHLLIISFVSSSVPQEKFVEYVTTSDDYKRNLNRLT